MLGVDSPEADAELIAVRRDLPPLGQTGPGRAAIYVNNRRLMDSQFEAMGIPPEKTNGCFEYRGSPLQDGLGQMDAYVLDSGFTQTQLNSLKAVLGNFDLWKQSDELIRLFAALESLGVKEYVKFDPNIVRGLLYYTSTVFEAFDTSGSVKRSILGGGRYDNLLSDVGGAPLPATGFAMGDVVIGIILKESGLLPEFVPTSHLCW